MKTIDLSTVDGPCRTAIFEPTVGRAPWPAVLFFMDGVGPRPSLYAMCERLAANGYLVALPDVFHRAGPYSPDELKSAIMDPAKRAAWREKYFASATNAANARADVAAVFDGFATRSDVRQNRYGTTGYCMGGFLSMTAAGNFPGQVAAAASFHGGFLASDAPNSPHLLASKMKAKVYVAAATDDASFPDDAKARLGDALTKAGVEHVIETYPARHGWAISDFPTYDAAACDRHGRRCCRSSSAP